MNNRKDSDIDSEGSRDSLDNINTFDSEVPENEEDMKQLEPVREAIRDWKLREQDKNTNTNVNAKSLKSLRNYVSNTGKLYYDLKNYLSTSQNEQKNMEDSYYVSIVTAIGQPGSLSSPLRILLERVLERDLIELPFTVEPNVINSYAKKNLKQNTSNVLSFPDEE